MSKFYMSLVTSYIIYRVLDKLIKILKPVFFVNKIRDNCRNFLKDFENLIMCKAPVNCLVHANTLINIIYFLLFLKMGLFKPNLV